MYVSVQKLDINGAPVSYDIETDSGTRSPE